MEQKDYKAIAEIMFEYLGGNDKDKKVLINKLADYFEKVDDGCPICKNHKCENCFNREQFLKDCGVKNDQS